MTPQEIDDAVLVALCELVEAEQPCPSHRALGIRVGVSEYAARASVRRLLKRGSVLVERSTFPYRRRIVVRLFGATGWSAAGTSTAKYERSMNCPAMELLTPDKNPWPAGCFAAHNLVMKDTRVPTKDAP